MSAGVAVVNVAQVSSRALFRSIRVTFTGLDGNKARLDVPPNLDSRAFPSEVAHAA
jgi:hypothetical protein